MIDAKVMEMKIIFHIDERANWKRVENNLNNLIKAQEDERLDLTVEVLANGEAVLNLTNSESSLDEDALQRAHELKPMFRICACHNSMKRFKITEDELLPFVDVVPVGVLELAHKQDEGYRYIKP